MTQWLRSLVAARHVVALVVVSAVIVSAGAAIRGADQRRSADIAQIAELRTIASTYALQVTLEASGRPGGSSQLATDLRDAVSGVEMRDGEATLPGMTGWSVDDPTALAGFQRLPVLLEAMLVAGDVVRSTSPDAASWNDQLDLLRRRTAAFQDVVADTALAMSTESNRTNDLQLMALTVLGVLGVAGVVSALFAGRREGRRRAAATFEALVQGASDWVVVVDDDDRVSYSTPTGEGWFTGRHGELVGRPLPGICADDAGAEVLRAALEEARAGDAPVAVEVTASTDIGNRRLSMRLTDLRSLGDVEGVVANVRDVTEQLELTSELERIAYHDDLTGLPNRALFIDHVRRSLARAARQGAGPSLLYVDLDDFKTINDAYGHSVGDELLRVIADRLVGVTRAEDVVARMGGDEFAVLLDATYDGDDVYALAERIDHVLRRPVNAADGLLLETGASMGIRTWQPDDTDAEVFLRDADVAMYVAKVDDKGGHRIFNAEMHKAVITRHELAQDLRTAIANDELWVAFQAKVAADDEHVVGAEALARWDHPLRGAISPGEFIPLAESTGLIVEIGRWVLEQGAMAIKALDQIHGLEHLRVSVNVSARQLTKGHFVRDVASVLAAHRIDPHRLVLEITESVIEVDPERCATQLQALRELGVTISIDDFGTGASSLSRLQDFPLDELKIDRAFIADSDHPGTKGLAMLRTIASLGRELGLSVVAEGVETTGQLDAVRGAGVDQVQGFLHGRPVPLTDFVARWVTPSLVEEAGRG